MLATTGVKFNWFNVSLWCQSVDCEYVCILSMFRDDNVNWQVVVTKWNMYFQPPKNYLHQILTINSLMCLFYCIRHIICIGYIYWFIYYEDKVCFKEPEKTVVSKQLLLIVVCKTDYVHYENYAP